MSSRAWKLVGLAGIVGVTTAGVIVARRRRRAWEEVGSSELRQRLHERLGDAGDAGPGPAR